MLSIGALGHGQGNYYVSLAEEQGEYYTEGTEPQGRWRGPGAEALNLPPLVTSETFLNVFEGFSPDRERTLTQNAGAESRQPGWDLTFSAPKSVSVLWSQADPDTRDAIAWAHELACEKALGFLEEQLTLTRRGKGGKEQEAVDPVIATFDHSSSRAGDPQLHTHCLVLNIGVREDGTTGSLLSHPFYEQKMLLGAIYRAELAQQLEIQVSLHSQGEGRTFEVLGVPEGLCEEFSKRREAIEQVLEAKGKHSAEASAWAALETRSAKGPTSREDLFTLWKETGQEYGFGEGEISHLRHQSAEKLTLLSRDKEEQKAVTEAMGRLTQKGSYFSEWELLKETLYGAPGNGFSLDEAKKAVQETLQDESQTFHLGIQDGITLYTTPEVRRLHEEAIAELEEGQKQGDSRPESTSGETRAMNRAVQEERKQSGASGDEAIEVGKESLFAGDRVRFEKTDRTLDLRRGDFGTVTAVFPEENRVEVRLDREEKQLLVPLSDYSHFSLGDATTGEFAPHEPTRIPSLSDLPAQSDFTLQKDRERENESGVLFVPPHEQEQEIF